MICESSFSEGNLNIPIYFFSYFGTQWNGVCVREERKETPTTICHSIFSGGPRRRWWTGQVVYADAAERSNVHFPKNRFGKMWRARRPCPSLGTKGCAREPCRAPSGFGRKKGTRARRASHARHPRYFPSTFRLILQLNYPVIPVHRLLRTFRNCALN